MPGFLDFQDVSANRIEIARQSRLACGKKLLDFTCSNPTKHGYHYPRSNLLPAISRCLSNQSYEPNSHGLLTAREAISRYYRGRSPTLEINPEHIFITASTSEAYSLLLTLLCDPGDNILVPKPSYPLLDLLSEAHFVEAVSYHLKSTRSWSIARGSLFALLNQRSRAIVVVSPNNPTGVVLDQKLQEISDLNLPIIADEVFAEFTENFAAPALAAIYPDVPVFHLNGISKMFALPDFKLGWVALNQPAYQIYGERLALLNDSFLSCSYLIQSILDDIFKSGSSFMHVMTRDIADKRKRLMDMLRQIPCLELVDSLAGSFVFPRLLIEVDEEEFVLDLIEHGLLVHPGYFYGAQEPGHFMLSCLLSEPEMQQATEILRTVLAKRKR